MFRSLLAVVMVFLASCGRSPTSPSAIDIGIRLEATVDRAQIRPGDTVRVRVVARNVSKSTIQITDVLVECALTLEVSGPGPINYYRSARLCEGTSTPAGPAPINILPGDSLVGVGVWPGRTYVSSSGTVLGAEGPATPGAYYAVPRIWTGLRSCYDGTSARIDVVAP